MYIAEGSFQNDFPGSIFFYKCAFDKMVFGDNNDSCIFVVLTNNMKLDLATAIEDMFGQLWRMGIAWRVGIALEPKFRCYW